MICYSAVDIKSLSLIDKLKLAYTVQKLNAIGLCMGRVNETLKVL